MTSPELRSTACRLGGWAVRMLFVASVGLACVGGEKASDSDGGTTPAGTTDVSTSEPASTDGSTGANGLSTTAASDDGESEGLDTAVDTGTSTTPTSTTTGSTECRPHPAWNCSEPWQCSDAPQFDCGKVSSWLDEDGCVRRPCSEDDPCPAGDRCHQPSTECDGCLSPFSCGEGERFTCTPGDCSFDGVCGASVCVDEVLFPVGYCDPE